MADWSNFFVIEAEAGTILYVAGTCGYNGLATFQERSATLLTFHLDVDAWGPWAALHATLTFEYTQEGAGNSVTLTRDGQEAEEDVNATMKSDDARQLRAVDSSVLTCSIYRYNDKVGFDLYLDDHLWKFILQLP